MNDARFRRLRKRVIATKNLPGHNILLRRYLREKARRGHWDPRYCDYNHVDPNVTPKLKAAITRGFAAGLVPTSTLRFPVGGGSWHQARDAKGRGRAIDMGNRKGLIGTLFGRRRMVKFQLAEFERPGWEEVIGPDNDKVVLKGKQVVLAEGTALENQHDTHVHVADSS